MFKNFIKNLVLSKFYKINLSNFEKSVANDSIFGKYIPAFKRGIISGILVMPALLLLDTDIIVQVLIPVTMVAGTAWFSVSLASMKKKFEKFGLELTSNLFGAFLTSLIILFLVTAFSLSKSFWHEYVITNFTNPILYMCSAAIGIFVVGNVIYQIFLGSLKYDINDAMLTGQNEAAEKFFKKALSVLYSTASTLKETKSLQVANYLIGVSFFEIFQHIHSITGDNKLSVHIQKANELVFRPSMPKAKADKIAFSLLDNFLTICVLSEDQKANNKHFTAIQDELKCLKQNKKEKQEMIDIRLSVIFEEIAALMEDFGESLFINPDNNQVETPPLELKEIASTTH